MSIPLHHELADFERVPSEMGDRPDAQHSRQLGSLAVLESDHPDLLSLPVGYAFDLDDSAAMLREAVDLMKTSEAYHDLDSSDLLAAYESHKAAGIIYKGFGVRTDTGQLVGYGGLIHKSGKGEMGLLIVSPDHQSNGIGRAIVDARLQYADEVGLTALYIDALLETNTLLSYYLSKGFVITPEGNAVRGDNPEPISE